MHLHVHWENKVFDKSPVILLPMNLVKQCGFWMGCPTGEVILDPKVAMQMGNEGQAGTC